MFGARHGPCSDFLRCNAAARPVKCRFNTDGSPGLHRTCIGTATRVVRRLSEGGASACKGTLSLVSSYNQQLQIGMQTVQIEQLPTGICNFCTKFLGCFSRTSGCEQGLDFLAEQMILVASAIAAGEDFALVLPGGRHPRQGEKQKCELHARRNLEHARLQPLRKSSTIVDGRQSPSMEEDPRVAWFLGLARDLQTADFHLPIPNEPSIRDDLRCAA